MREVAMLINEQKRRMENIGKIGLWQQSIDGWKVHVSWNQFQTGLKYVAVQIVLCPDPTSKGGKGSGDNWTISWFCGVSSLVFVQANQIVALCFLWLFHSNMLSAREHKALWIT